MIISEETGRRIAESLERLERLLKDIPVMPRLPEIDPGFAVHRCGFCGGSHANGLPCPMLSPEARQAGGF